MKTILIVEDEKDIAEMLFEEDYMLFLEANSRLEANGEKQAVSFKNVLGDLGISEADLEDVEEVDIE